MKKLMLSLGFITAISTANAQSWQLKPWQKYVIEQKIQADTLNTSCSIMGQQSPKVRKVAPEVFRFGTFYVLEPKGILEEMEERAREGQRSDEYESSGSIFADIIGSILNIIFFR